MVHLIILLTCKLYNFYGLRFGEVSLSRLSCNRGGTEVPLFLDSRGRAAKYMEFYSNQLMFVEQLTVSQYNGLVELHYLLNAKKSPATQGNSKIKWFTNG